MDLKDDNIKIAIEIIKDLYFIIQDRIDYKDNIPLNDTMERTRNFLIKIKEL